MKLKFSCACPVNFGGRVCEIPPSCLDIKSRDPQVASGEYTMQDTLGNFFKTYCDLSSEEDFVWTLIEIFSMANLQHFAGAHFGRDWPRNDRSMNWLEFRLTQNAMNYINNQGATHFRATCDFEEDAFVPTTWEERFRIWIFSQGVATSPRLALNTSGCESLELAVTTAQRKPGTHQAITCT